MLMNFRYRPPDVLLGSTDYTTSLDIWYVRDCCHAYREKFFSQMSNGLFKAFV